MKKIFYGLILVLSLGSCSGPTNFNSQADYFGGNRSAAIENHCASKAAAGKDTLVYKLCEQSYNTHYRK